MAQQKHAPEPEGFRPIEVTPPELDADVATPEWAPIEVTPYTPPEAAPVAPTQKPATGKED